MEQLYTRWGKQIDSDNVLQAYPRPLLQRESYVNLNGYWDYAVTRKFRKPDVYDGKILVPFSPESLLSGVGRQLKPEEYLWYRRKFTIDDKKLQAGARLLLHFGAVDQACRVYVNGKEAVRHTGGYLPFSADITAHCMETAEKTGVPDGRAAELVVAVRDLSDTSYHTRGKQKLKRGGMFYTAQSGIWQTVWMEYVPAAYIKELVTEPDLLKGCVRIRVCTDYDMPVTIQIREPGIYQSSEERKAQTEQTKRAEQGVPSEQAEPAGQAKQNVPKDNGGCGETIAEDNDSHSKIITEAGGSSNQTIEIALPLINVWTCEEPYLYYFTVIMGKDVAESYFALRTFTIEKTQDGIPRICLNGKVQFQNGVLDQGYWSDGLYTAPADEAFIFDILEMKKMGFNMIRKHIKIEPQRWYYHCDRLGMVVWQDMVNGGTYYKHWFVTYAATLISRKRWQMPDTCLGLLARSHREGRREFVREMKETIRLLKNHPSIAAWVIFNEGWGQFHAGKMTDIARNCDGSRLIDQASGWFDQNGGDMQSIHHYFFSFTFLPEKERATVLSEFGGYSLRIPGHSVCEKLYGYGIHKSKDSLNAAYRKRMQKVKAQIPDGLCASVYTQLSDVEEEVNGIFTYDREIRKIEKIQDLPDA